MRIPFLALLITFLLHPQAPPNTPPVVVRDPQTLVILQRSLSAMGGAPSSILATGTVALTEGSTNKLGSIRIETSGSGYTLENYAFSDESRTVVYAQGASSFKKDNVLGIANNATSLTMQSAIFVAPLLAGLLNDPDVSVRALGIESVGGSKAYHCVLVNTFNSAPDLKDFSKLTQRDVWVDSSTFLPIRLSYNISTGAGPGDVIIPVLVEYSNFGIAGGVTTPGNISVLLNGTQWLSVSVATVSVNSVLPMSDFQLN